MKILSLLAGACAALLVAVPAATLAQTAAAPARPAAGPRVEQRIQSLHDRLKITAAETPQWNAVADAMRDNARTVGALILERREKAATMSAVQDLRSYEAIAQAHAEGVAKLADAFQTLYDVMTPAQRKNADAIFAQAAERRAARKPPAK